MTRENFLTASWRLPGQVRTLITQNNTLASESQFGFNLARHVGEPEQQVIERRKSLSSELRVPSPIAWLEQESGNNVCFLDQVNIQAIVESGMSSPVAQADASFTFQASKVCVVSTADCLPILLSDSTGQFVAVIHAGWQGLKSGIITRFFARFLTEAKVGKVQIGEIHAYIAPSISQENYQVDSEFKQSFIAQNPSYEAFFKADTEEGKFLADLKRIATMQLLNEGVVEVLDSGICTYAHPSFYSYRRACHQNMTNCGRFVSMIWLEE